MTTNDQLINMIKQLEKRVKKSEQIAIPSVRNAFDNFIADMSGLLEGPTPPENPNCNWCKYRHLGEALAHPQTSDIPF